MADTYVTYTGDGVSNGPFTVPFQYISRDYVKVYVDGVEDQLFTWLSASQIELSSVPENGAIILIQRETPRNALIVEIPNSGTFRGRDINSQSRQVLDIVAEAFDALSTALAQDLSDGMLDAQGRRIKNVADPEEAQDAVTKNWAETAMSSQLQQAISARNAAQSAKTSAENAANTATTKAGEAADSALAASDSADAAANSANAATNSASDASDYATAAGNYATAAGNYASNAQDYANAAAESASDAEEYALDAAASASAAEELFDDFDSRYLGAFASNPTQDGNGDPLVVGALYFNTTLGEMRVYDGEAWKVAYIPSDELNASAVDFTPYGNIESGNVQDAIEELDDILGLMSSDILGILQDIADIESAITDLEGDILDLQENKQDDLGLEGVADGDDFRAGEDNTKALTTKSAYDASAEVTLTYANPLVINFSQGTNFVVTLQGSPEIQATGLNNVNGKMGRIRFIQDQFGNREPTWDSTFVFSGGEAPVFSSPGGAEDRAYYDICNGKVYIAFVEDVQ